MSRAALSAMAPERGFRGARSPRARSACAGGRGRDAVSRRQRSGKRVEMRAFPKRTGSRARRGRGVGEAWGGARTRGRLEARDGFGGWRGGPARAEPDPERSPPGAPRAGSEAGAAASSAQNAGAARCRPRGGETECRARARTERGRGRPPRAKRPPRRSETRGFEDRGGSPGAPSAPSRASRGALCRTGRRRSRTEQRWRVQTSGAKVRQAANQSAERNFGLKGRIDSDRV